MKKQKFTPEQAAEYRRKVADVEAHKEEYMEWAREAAREHDLLLAEFRDVFIALRDERQRQGLSLADVQELTGMPREAISRLENLGKANFRVETILRYAHALGLKVHVALSR
jgi:DNA-binding phage protein